jgi:hypothetical protein
LEGVVGEAGGLATVVGDVEEGDAGALADVSEDVADFGAGLVVEGGEGFVEAEDRRVEGEGSAESDALGFAAGEAEGEAVEEVGEAEPGGELVDAFLDEGLRPAADVEGEGEVLADGEVGEEGTVLGNESDAPCARGFEGDVATVDADAARYDGAEAADGFEEGGLASAGAAHEGGVAAARDVAGDVREAEGADLKGDVVEFDHGLRGGVGWTV